MATKQLKLVTIFSILLALQAQFTFSNSIEKDDDDETYLLDTPSANTQLRSRFLASINKGDQCSTTDGKNKNVCNGVSANKGANLLYCCKKQCCDVLGDANNCGGCGQKCGFGEKCCGGKCINVQFNSDNCGKCNNKCNKGKPCGYGQCGYA